MKKLLIWLSFVAFLNADEGVAKLVLDLTTGNLAQFEKKVLKGVSMNKGHYEGLFKELEVSVVIHGDAYRFFVKDPKNSPFKDDKALIKAHETLKKRIASLVENYEVEFLMCKAAMKKNQLEQKDIYDFVTMVPNSTIGLIDKQNEGFAYIPVSD